MPFRIIKPYALIYCTKENKRKRAVPKSSAITPTLPKRNPIALKILRSFEVRLWNLWGGVEEEGISEIRIPIYPCENLESEVFSVLTVKNIECEKSWEWGFFKFN